MKKLISFIFLSYFVFYSLSCTGVKNLGVFGLSRNNYVLGQDGITPVQLNNSVTMWTFGDTILRTDKPGTSASSGSQKADVIPEMISNSLAFTESPSSGNISALNFIFVKENGKVCQFIKNKKEENPARIRLWAVDGIRIENRMYVYYIITEITDPGIPFSFIMKGIGIAQWNIPDKWEPGGPVKFRRLPDIFPSGYPAFGVTVLERDGCLYTAGQYAAKDKTSPVKIARVKKNLITERTAYEFLSGKGGWVSDIDKAGSFLGDVMGECSISYNDYLRCYIIIYCQQWTGSLIMVRFNDFSALFSAEKEKIYDPPRLEQKDKPLFYYSGKEIFSEDRHIFMIYINPLEYQPYLLKVNLQI